ncbi:DUF2970 domain-containing protein [Bordetella genomosp. 9]|uniref:DUF2970 domain-containing protein n=1 Tax=Bordetella genomosp. 9 TaxID=1416803 RepID=A0A1W6YUX8_9BORD|nr:DUF2970 domain-containing protein [Bordetella genomosp. 9]ARP84900.1 hypothetical protein CAL13_00665 [Bordetella genomosp. 9]ARP88989.1 hypothetical protein CAL14_00660 [Bordetella genomosp. 9]
MSDDRGQGPQSRPTFLHTMRAVAWGMLGIRKGAAYREDATRLNPVHLVIAGVLAGAIFVAVLVLIVRWVVANVS